MKYASDETAEKLAALFELPPPDAFSQEWEFCIVELDWRRLEKMIDCCHSMPFSKDERHALMVIILNSIERQLRKAVSSARGLWPKVVQLLAEDREEYEDLMERFMALDSDPEDRFFISPLLIQAFPPDIRG